MAGSLLRQRDVRLIVGAVGLSALGDFLALVPLALYLQAHTGSGVVVALLFVALWCPVVVLAGPAGLLADRVETRRLLIVVSLVQAAIAVALAFVDSTIAILVLTTLLGSAFAVAQPAEFALIPALVREERLSEINGYVETARYVGMTIGPAVGGVVAGVGGRSTALLVDAATFVAVAAGALVLRARRRPTPAPDGEPADRARAGLVYLARDRVLRLVLGVGFVSLCFMTASASAEVFFVKDVLGAGDAGFGVLLSIWTLGMALGALVISRRVPASMLAVGALVAVVVQSAGLGLPTLWLSVGLAALAWLVGGAAHGTKNVLMRTLIHERVPDRLRGRAYAAYNGLRNGAELVALICGGVLVNAVGSRWTLFLAGAIPFAVGLVGLALARRRLPVEAAPATAGLTAGEP